MTHGEREGGRQQATITVHVCSNNKRVSRTYSADFPQNTRPWSHALEATLLPNANGNVATPTPPPRNKPSLLPSCHFPPCTAPHLAERHEARRVPDGGRSVASQIRHGAPLQNLAGPDANAHPRPAALVLRARVGIEVEAGHVF